MYQYMIRHVSYLLLLTLAACASLPMQARHSQIDTRGIDGIACIGSIITPPAGLLEIHDNALLQQALGASGEGKLCAGKVFVAKKPVTVYRLWNSDKAYTAYGRWWSLSLPTGPKAKYRKDNDICPSWSRLDRMSVCTLKIGTKIVLGPGQSAKCKNTTYAKSPVNQVFVPNDSRQQRILVEKCSEGVAWP